MAKIPNVYLISIFLIMCSLSLPSDGLMILGYNITSVTIQGALYCNFTGQPNPVSNAVVSLSCGGTTTSIARAVTDINGVFTIVLNYLQTLLFNPSFCGLGTSLPLGACGAKTPQSILNVPLTLLSIINNNTAVFGPSSAIFL